MSEEEFKIDPLFMNLVMMLQMSAMQTMGKIASPISGKVERNLEQSRISIDMLDMVDNKTKGNLNKDEDQFLKSTLYNLRMNFVEESEKPEPDEGDSEKPEKSDQNDAPEE